MTAWLRRIAKSIRSQSDPVFFGAPLEGAPVTDTGPLTGLPLVFTACVDYLSKRNVLHTVGLFRSVFGFFLVFFCVLCV